MIRPRWSWSGVSEEVVKLDLHYESTGIRDHADAT